MIPKADRDQTAMGPTMRVSEDREENYPDILGRRSKELGGTAGREMIQTDADAAS